MSPSASSASLVFPDSPGVDSRAPELSPSKREPKPDRSFSDLMDRATARKGVPAGSSSEAPFSTTADQKAPPESSAPRKRIAPSRSPTIDLARPEQPASTLAVAAGGTASTRQISDASGAQGESPSEPETATDEGVDTEAPTDCLTIIVPLIAPSTPTAPVIPTLIPADATGTARPGTNPNDGPTVGTPAAESTETHPGEFSDGETDDGQGIDLRTLGLHPVSQRERAALELRAALSRLEAEEAGERSAWDNAEADLASKIIPFPVPFGRESKIVPVQFRPRSDGAPPAQTTNEALETSATQLPGGGSDREKTAGSTAHPANAERVIEGTSGPAKTQDKAPFHWGSEDLPPSDSGRGTSAARKERNMDSRSASANFDPAGDEGSLPEVSRDATDSPAPSLHNAHRASGVEWSSPSHWNTVSSVSLDATSTPVDAAGTVEKISKIVNRETVLFRQHNSDSMAVVLRPDSNTELFLHLSRKDGQIEASVRCERGDYHQLNALWSQLQESLAQQKVRLTPLQESSGDPGSAFRQQSANGFDHAGRDHSSRQPTSDNEFMDEWPAPASRDQQPAHVRSRGESGQRLSTSRPGWETWA